MLRKNYNKTKIQGYGHLGNNKGIMFLTSIFVVIILIGLIASFAILSSSELNNSKRYQYSTAAFWAAEAGVNKFIHNTSMLDIENVTEAIGLGFVSLEKDDSNPALRIVTATGTYNDISRSIQIEFPANPPSLFDNTISSGANIILDGFISGMSVDGKTRLSGEYDDQGFWTTANFEDKVEGVDNGLTTLTYPDLNENGQEDFDDFVSYNRRFVDPEDPDYTGEYSEDEVLHIQTNGAVDIWPNEQLVGKKVVFIEGSSAGQGDARIWFDATWRSDQNITIISTGSVDYVQPLQSPAANSQLNTISWDDYNEAAILLSTHSGSTYTHEDANYGSIISLSHTTGNLIANGGVHLDLIFVWKMFDYENPVDENGLVPPGFQGLINTSSSGYSDTPSSWAEI
ncbi:MAG: hypothetical protein P9X22_00970 [Candidatus Zapsychrus exili]|nr:hypothetical protein [Candidatus Zapsychrus exili]